MLKVSSKGRYALRLMLDLARHCDENVVPLKDIAQRQQITVKYLELIMALLLKAGLVSSTRGKAGGYRLARQVEQYTVFEIVEAVEGPLAIVHCLAKVENDCPMQHSCATLPVWTGLDKCIRDYLSSITLSELMNHGAEASFCAGI